MTASYRIETNSEEAFLFAMEELDRMTPETTAIRSSRGYKIKRLLIRRKILNDNSGPEGQ